MPAPSVPAAHRATDRCRFRLGRRPPSPPHRWRAWERRHGAGGSSAKAERAKSVQLRDCTVGSPRTILRHTVRLIRVRTGRLLTSSRRPRPRRDRRATRRSSCGRRPAAHRQTDQRTPPPDEARTSPAPSVPQVASIARSAAASAAWKLFCWAVREVARDARLGARGPATAATLPARTATPSSAERSIRATRRDPADAAASPHRGTLRFRGEALKSAPPDPAPVLVPSGATRSTVSEQRCCGTAQGGRRGLDTQPDGKCCERAADLHPSDQGRRWRRSGHHGPSVSSDAVNATSDALRR